MSQKQSHKNTPSEPALRLEWLDPKELAENPGNWKKHPTQQLGALEDLLGEVGWAGALLFNETTNRLIDGHARKKVEKDSKVPVLIGNWTPEQEAKILLTLDPLASLAETDGAKVKELLARVNTDSEAIGALLERIAGQDAWQVVNEPKPIVDPEAQIDKAAELKAQWCTAPGQLWQIGDHKLLCGDCREKGDVERLWRAAGPKLTLLWTDPPYGVDYGAKNAYLNRSDRGNRIQVPIENDNLSAGETGLMFKKALEVAKQFAEPGAVCYATVPGGPLLVYFIQAMQASGFEFKHQLVWVKQQFVIGMADYHHRFEPILYGWLPNGAHYFVDDRTQDDVFEVDRPHVSDTHPTCKPIELIARMISNSSRNGELVFDPFAGSGSTLLAAHQLGRVGYGIEIDPRYVAVALERLSTLGLKPELVE
jgi:DNA modification methylase